MRQDLEGAERIVFRRASLNLAVLSFLLDGLSSAAGLWLAVRMRPALPALPLLQPLREIQMPFFFYVAAPAVWLFALALASVYDARRVLLLVDELQRVLIGSALAALSFAGLLYLTVRDVPRSLFLLSLLLTVCLLLGRRLLLRWLLRSGQLAVDPRRVLIVGGGTVGQRVAGVIARYEWTGVGVIGFLDNGEAAGALLPQPLLGGLADLADVVAAHGVDDVVIALPQHDYGTINRMLAALRDRPVDVRVVPDYFSLALYRARAEEFGGLPLISLRDPAMNDGQRLVKRLFDLTLGGLLLLLALPLLLLGGLLVLWDSGRPIFFHQERVGENGQHFTMWKFRTMAAGAPPPGDHKRPDDPRITRVGRFLRQTSIDELPQLINVLRGEMSLVGPRPELPWLVDRYEPWQRVRFAVPQGITGWWQVNGRADRPLHEHTEDDLYYIQNYSLWIDLYILIKTPLVVLRGKGAY